MTPFRTAGKAIAASALALVAVGTPFSPAMAQWSDTEMKGFADAREEELARTIGSLAYVYAYPVVDYYWMMYEQTTPGKDPTGAYAPINHFFANKSLTVPGGPYAGRSPNADTLYFQSWIDLRNGPIVISAPDTADRYYNLDFVDMYSETDAHTGRRTTGTYAQDVYVVGPKWQGETPKGMHLVRMATEQGLVLGRILIKSDDELAKVSKIVSQFTIREAEGTAPAPTAAPYSKEILNDLRFFEAFNRFLKTAAAKPEERALMDQFDAIGIGPKSTFDPGKISEATRRGLLQAIKAAQPVVENGRKLRVLGWSPVKTKIGVYGNDYFQRAAVEYAGLLANMPEEAVYPRYRADLQGNAMDGKNRYRIVMPAKMPVDAFWSLSAYSGATRDLIPNPQGIYSVSDRDPKHLKRRADGTAVVLIQSEKPAEKDVNWLPVKPGGMYVLLRLYQPKPDAFAPGYKLPEVEKLD